MEHSTLVTYWWCFLFLIPTMVYSVMFCNISGVEQIMLMKQKCKIYHSVARRALDDNDSFNHELVKVPVYYF